MDGIINVKAYGSHISKDSQTAGVRGEAGVSYLRITFDESWDGFAKRVVFWDAQGKNTVARTLVAHEPEDVRLFIVDIPGEALAVAGKMTFVIDGLVLEKLKRRVKDTLVVKDSPTDDEPVERSPDEFVAIQQDIEDLRGDIQGAYDSCKDAEEAKEQAREYSLQSASHADIADGYRMEAEEARDEAQQFAAKASNAIGKVPFVGENGNWFAWEGNGETFYDTGVKAQAGATVYYGKNPPDEADVWIDPDGESSMSAPYIGENGNWYTFDEESQTFKDSGKPSVDADVREMLNILRSDVEYNRQLIENQAYQIKELYDVAVAKKAFVVVKGGSENWTEVHDEDDSGNIIRTRYAQVVNVNNAVVTANSKVDLQVTDEQFSIFYEKDVAFHTENDNGVVTVYCVGNIPENDYEFQVVVTEVV